MNKLMLDESSETILNESDEIISGVEFLIIDDDFLITQEIAEMVNSIGYKYFTSTDPYEAIELFKNNKGISIVITDYSMPGMTGFELLDTLKKGTNNEDRYFNSIMVTGQAGMDEALNAIKIGMTDFLLKPINTDSFEASIKKSVQKVQEQITRKQHIHALKKNIMSLQQIENDVSDRLFDVLSELIYVKSNLSYFLDEKSPSK
ncbi:MAG: response regulator [Gammaproteobacteria bacterium]|nr:response regulator [Gammaproteobacteria bacterium]